MRTFTAVLALFAMATAGAQAAGGTLTTFSKAGCAGTKQTFKVNSGVQECIPVTGAAFTIDNPKCITIGFQTNDCDGMESGVGSQSCTSFNFQSVIVNCKNA